MGVKEELLQYCKFVVYSKLYSYITLNHRYRIKSDTVSVVKFVNAMSAAKDVFSHKVIDTSGLSRAVEFRVQEAIGILDYLADYEIRCTSILRKWVKSIDSLKESMNMSEIDKFKTDVLSEVIAVSSNLDLN